MAGQRLPGDPGPIRKGFKVVRTWQNALRKFVIRGRVIAAPGTGFQETESGVLPPPREPKTKPPLLPFIFKDKDSGKHRIGVEWGWMVARGAGLREFFVTHVPKIASSKTSDGTALTRTGAHDKAVTVKSSHNYLILELTYGEPERHERKWLELCEAVFYPAASKPTSTQCVQRMIWAEIKHDDGASGSDPRIDPDKSWQGGNFEPQFPYIGKNCPPCPGEPSAGSGGGGSGGSGASTSGGSGASAGSGGGGSSGPAPSVLCVKKDGIDQATLNETPNGLANYEDEDETWQLDHFEPNNTWYLSEDGFARGEREADIDDPAGDYGDGYTVVVGPCALGSGSGSGDMFPEKLCLEFPSTHADYPSEKYTLCHNGDGEYVNENDPRAGGDGGAVIEYRFVVPENRWIVDVDFVHESESVVGADPGDPVQALSGGFTLTEGPCPTSSASSASAGSASSSGGGGGGSEAAPSAGSGGSGASAGSGSGIKGSWLLPVKTKFGKEEIVAQSPIESSEELFMHMIEVPVDRMTGRGALEIDSYILQTTHPGGLRVWSAMPVGAFHPRGQATGRVVSGAVDVVMIEAPKPGLLARITGRARNWPGLYRVILAGPKVDPQGKWVGSPTRNPKSQRFTRAHMESNMKWHRKAYETRD